MNTRKEPASQGILVDRPGSPHGIVGVLRESIERGDYQSGSRLPTERALAETFGVERYFIRRALDQLVNERLIVRQHGCRPFVRADIKRSAPRASDSALTLKTIAFVNYDLGAGSSASAFTHGIASVLRSEGTRYRLLYFNTRGSTEEIEREAASTIEKEGVLGAIVLSDSDESILSIWRPIQEHGYPLVFIDRYHASLRCDYVGVDNVGSAKEAVGYLLRLGHRRIMHLTIAALVSSTRERIAGYKAALRDAGITPEDDWIHFISNDLADVASYAEQIINAADPPTAIFAVNDLTAHELITCLEARGKTVPGDFSVIGFDDLDRFSSRPVLLTSMQQPFEQMGEQAAELLLQRLSPGDGAELPYQHVLFKTGLIERLTCRALTS